MRAKNFVNDVALEEHNPLDAKNKLISQFNV